MYLSLFWTSFLAATILPGGSEVCEVAVEDSLEGVAELPLADEGLELLAQLSQGLLVGGVGDARLPVVGEPCRAGVSVEQFINFHGTIPPPWSVMPWAR